MGDRDSPVEEGSIFGDFGVYGAAAMSAVGGAVSGGVRGAVDYIRGSSSEGQGESEHHGSEQNPEIVEGGDHRVTDQHESQSEIRGLKEKLKDSDKKRTELSHYNSELSREMKHLKGMLVSKDIKIAAMRQEARELELKQTAEISKLLSGGEGGGGDAEQRLHDHINNQSRTISELRETLEMASDHMQEADDERDKLREDFESARKEIKAQKERNDRLEHQLTACEDKVGALKVIDFMKLADQENAIAKAEIGGMVTAGLPI